MVYPNLCVLGERINLILSNAVPLGGIFFILGSKVKVRWFITFMNNVQEQNFRQYGDDGFRQKPTSTTEQHNTFIFII